MIRHMSFQNVASRTPRHNRVGDCLNVNEQEKTLCPLRFFFCHRCFVKLDKSVQNNK